MVEKSINKLYATNYTNLPLFYHFLTEDSLLKEWEERNPVSRWEMNVGRL